MATLVKNIREAFVSSSHFVSGHLFDVVERAETIEVVMSPPDIESDVQVCFEVTWDVRGFGFNKVG